MNKNRTIFSRISALLLVTVLLITSLSGCYNIQISSNSVVVRLAEDQEIPEFDTSMFANVELVFNAHYYTDLPDNTTLYENTKAAFFEYCGEVDKSDINAITHALIDCYIYAVGDKYAFFRNAEELEDYTSDMSGSFVGIGVSVLNNSLENTILITGIEPDSPAQAAGLQPNDYIIAVDGALVSEIGTSAAVNKIKGEIGTTVQVTVQRDGQNIVFTLIRDIITETFVTYQFIEDTKIVYVKIKSFKGDNSNNTYLQFCEAVDFAEANGAEGIIFDLCANPGGYLHLVTDMISYLVPNGTLIASFSSNKQTIYADNDGTASDPKDHVLTLPSVVVFDKNSASAAELFSGALRDYNEMGILKSSSVGEITFGKGIMQSTVTFSNNSAITLTTALYNPPSGENFHGVGVIPNILAEDGDDFIALAIEELNKMIADTKIQ